MSDLHVFWGDRLVGRLAEKRSGFSFRYAEVDSPMISVAMPPTTRTYGDAAARPFFSGLLPEGEARRIIAYDLGLDSDGGTDFEMLAALGADCAGALVVTPDDHPPSPPTQPVVALDDAAIARKLRALPNEPLGLRGDVRVSLTGMQAKLPLARSADGSWTVPLPGRPSTHILKPPSTSIPDAVANEVFCMKLARSLAMAAAETDLVVFDGIPTLVSTRYDRRTDADGNAVRVHQEDGCQALSILVRIPHAKYQHRDGGPSLRAIAGVLDRWASRRSLEALLDQTLLTVIVGNADFHGKNVSLLHDGAIALAPLYDVMSTTGLTTSAGQPLDTTLGMWIGSATGVDTVGIGDVLDEAVSWGLRRDAARRHIEGVLDRLPDAVDSAADSVASLPGERLELVRRRAARLRDDAVQIP